MNVSLYIKDDVVKKIDGLARKAKVSRSRFLQSLLEKVLMGKENKSLFDEVYGVLSPEQADEFLQTIRSSRQNSSRFN